MKTIKFTRDTHQDREGGEGWKAGDVVTLQDSSAARWLRRSAAVEVSPEAPPIEQPPTPVPTPAPVPAPTPAGAPAPAPVQQHRQTLSVPRKQGGNYR